MKKILFPTDFSEVSKNAFIYALKLADAIDAEIITLHVYQLDSPMYLDVSIYLKEIYEYEELSNFENYRDEVPLLRNIAEINNLGHIKLSNVLLQGSLVDEVAKIAKSEDVDCIVMGTKGATHLSEVFLGTMATQIMNESETTVLAIPDKCQFTAIEKILFTTKYQMKDIQALHKVISLAKLFHSHIDCLNVKPPHSMYKDDFIIDFKNIFKKENVDFHSVMSSDIEGEILKYIEKHHINMLAIHVRHRGFFEKLFQISLSKKLAFHSKIPILSVK